MKKIWIILYDLFGIVCALGGAVGMIIICLLAASE
jgi:hypothetical protein